MKKIIFLAVILAVGMVSCQNKQEQVKEERVEEEQVKELEVGTELNLFLEECLSKVPNARDNHIAKRRLRDTITALMEKKIGDTLDLINNYPMKINSYVGFDPIFLGWNIKSKKSYKGKYLVTFKNSICRNMVTQSGYSSEFEVTTVMEPDSLEKLKDDGKYKLQGIFKGFINPINIDRGFMNSLDISLGRIFLEDIKIEPFEEENI